MVIGDQSNNSNAVVVVVRAVIMACLFGCFKIKDVTNYSNNSESKSNRIESTPTKECLMSHNRSPLSSLFTEENDEINTLGCKEVENQSSNTHMTQLDKSVLRHQDKFLKACGTFAEIRNFSTKCKDRSAPMQEVELLKLWTSDSTYQKLNLNPLPDQPTPVKIDGVKNQSGSLVHMPSSWNSNLKNMAREL